MMPQVPPDGRGRRASAGGARAAGGIDNQARVAAWLTSLVVTDQPVPWLPDGARVEAVGGDTGMAMDDVGALSDRGGLVAIQAKGGLTLDTRPTSPLAAAVDQAVEQFRSGVPDSEQTRPVDPDRDRLVILGNGTSSKPIRTLGEVTARLRTLPAAVPLTSAAINKTQDTALAVLRAHIERAWTSAADAAPTDDEIRALLRVLVVDVLDLDDGGSDRATTTVHLQATLLDPASTDRAWNHLVELGRRLSVERSWRRRPDLAAHLASAGTPVGPSAHYMTDVRALLRISEATLQSLAEHATLPTTRGKIHCERAAAADLVKVDGSFVLIGAPGCGKSGVIYEIASHLADEDVIALSVDTLADDAGATRTNFGLHHDLVDVLQQWSGDGRATLILDGLDAARGEATAWLSRLASSLSYTRWRIIASIRRFDLQHNLRWQQIFRGDPVAPGDVTEATDIPRVRHYLLGDLTNDELNTLARSSQEIADLLERSSTQLIDLLCNPFNLRLAAELLELGESVDSMASARDQLQLLQRYWRSRVSNGPRGRSRIRVLTALVEEMLRTRRLRADDSVVPVGLDDDVHALLHDGVLQEVSPLLIAASSPMLVFSHHILFDYAAAALVLASPDGSQLGQRLRGNPDLAVIARPSVDLHLADLWHADPTRARFAATVDDLVAGDQVLAGIAAARVVIENAGTGRDTIWLAERFRDDAKIALTITSWLCGVMDAADPLLMRRLHAALAIWAELTGTATEVLQRQFTLQTGQAALLLLRQLDQLSPLMPRATDAAVRAASTARLMTVCLTAGADGAWLAPGVARLLPRAVAVDGELAGTLLATINDAALAEQRTEVLSCFVQQIECIAQTTPDTAAAVLSAAWEYDDDSDETTYLTRGVLSLTSTRRQDLNHLRWLTGEKFPAFICATGVLCAARTVGAVLDAVTGRRDDAHSKPLEAFGAEGRLLDFAPELRYGPGHGVPLEIVRTFLGALDDVVDEQEAKDIVAVLVASVSHPEFWSRLLTAAREKPQWHVPVATALASGALLANTQTRAASGELMGVLSAALEPEQHSRLLEQPIQQAAELFPLDAAHWREQAVDQLLGYLDVSRVQDSAMRERLANLLAGDGPPRAPEPSRITAGWSSIDLAEVLGQDTYNALGDDARTALEELRRVLSITENGGEDTAALENSFRCAVAETAGVTAETVHELVTRAADRLTGSPAVLPGTDLGELVVTILFEAAQQGGAKL
jgi:hypothetical protein